jgi:integrase
MLATSDPTEAVLAAAWRRALDPGVRGTHVGALRDLALVELMAGVGLHLSEVRLLAVADLTFDPTGEPAGLPTRVGEARFELGTRVALSRWLTAREGVLPGARLALPVLGPSTSEGAFPRARDAPPAMESLRRALIEVNRRAGVHTTPAGLAAAAPTAPVLAAARRATPLGFLVRPPVAWCDACGRRWQSRALAEALDGGRCPSDGRAVRVARRRPVAAHAA